MIKKKGEELQEMKKAKRVEGKGKRDEINEIKQIIKRMLENVGILKRHHFYIHFEFLNER